MGTQLIGIVFNVRIIHVIAIEATFWSDYVWIRMLFHDVYTTILSLGV